MATLQVVHTPKTMILRTSTTSPRVATPTATDYKPMILPKGAWQQFKRLTHSGATDENKEEAKYETTALIVRLRFTHKNKVQVVGILDQPAMPKTPLTIFNQSTTPPSSSPNTPATARTAQSIHARNILD
jgi:hypothetical protein